jgi:hypothetical protein
MVAERKWAVQYGRTAFSRCKPHQTAPGQRVTVHASNVPVGTFVLPRFGA